MRHMAFDQRNAFHKTMKESSCTDRGFFCILPIHTGTHSISMHQSVLHKNSKENSKEVKFIV